MSHAVTQRTPLDQRVGNGVAVTLGAAAFLASAIHVYSVGRDNGAEQVVSVLVTVGVELLAFVSMLELRRGFRWPPFAGLLLGVAATVSANLATAGAGLARGYGWEPRTVAVAPAVLFLAVLAIIHTRPRTADAPASADARPAAPERASAVSPDPESADAPTSPSADRPAQASADAGPADELAERRTQHADDPPVPQRRPQHIPPDVQAIMDELHCGRTKAIKVRDERRAAAAG